jgi:two-component system LytT family response regulator
MRVIIVDDEPIAIELLGRMLTKYEDVQVVGFYSDPQKALAGIKELKPDVVFLDIELGEINGLEIADRIMSDKEDIDTDTDIVFVTAYSQYAVGAFEVNAIDYLLKPLSEERLGKTLDKLRNRFKKDGARNREKDKETEIEKDKVKRLKINSFLNFYVQNTEGYILSWRTQKSKELLAFLWVNERTRLSKNLIMENVFPERDLDKATTLLHTTVYQLRKTLEAFGYRKGITYKNDGYSLELPVNSDKQELDSILNSRIYEDEMTRRVLEIYKGDFFEEEGYIWIAGLQLKYREEVTRFLINYFKAQIMINKTNKTNKTNPLIRVCLDKFSVMEPYNEEIAKLVIEYYGIKRDRIKLDNYFKRYINRLWEEMRLRPAKDTVDLFKRYIGL